MFDYKSYLISTIVDSFKGIDCNSLDYKSYLISTIVDVLLVLIVLIGDYKSYLISTIVDTHTCVRNLMKTINPI